MRPRAEGGAGGKSGAGGRARRSPGPAARVLTGLAIVLAVAACAEPSGSYGDYRAKVHRTALEMISAVSSAELAARELIAGRSTGPFADSVVTDAEKDAGSAQTALDSRQPPDSRSIALRDKAGQAVQSAVSGLAELRIAVRRGSTSGIRRALGELAKPLKQLEAFGS